MQIIIPMSGFGERFRRAGYRVPKPLIEVDGKPIIAHVVDLFPGEQDFTFICNREHLEEPAFRLREVLAELCPTGKVVAIEPHHLGPVHAVLEAANHIDPDEPTIVNYCDFTCFWDFGDFKTFVRDTECDGAIPAYRGFHPHMLSSTSFAYLNEVGGWVRDIREKESFTDDPTNEYASSGTYYFSSGGLVLRAFREAKERNLTVGGEYYVSLACKPLLDAGLPVAAYELQHFMQWGTPDDLNEYRRWSAAFRRLAETRDPLPKHQGATLIPAAGFGTRFAEAGYEQDKPAIPVSGQPMVLLAARTLPDTPRHRFIFRRELGALDELRSALEQAIPGADMTLLDTMTDGQARTCLLGLDGLDLDAPLTIGACDNEALFDRGLFDRMMADDDVDVLVWGVRGHPDAMRRPNMFGWIDLNGTPSDAIGGVSVKEPLGDPANDPIVIGTFTFKRARDFVASAERMIERDARVNGEFYVDTCINDAIALGLDCRVFMVDHYLGWGTPDDLRTFEYWQSCFHKWASHPYSLDRDSLVPSEAVGPLAERYGTVRPPRPNDR
jgi:NDP-sugar pyrophosphorylase family protein